MSDKCLSNELRFAALKNEGTRQRWELFHRAIALAKQSNAKAVEEADKRQQGASASGAVRERPEPQLSIAR